jgi:hypothetical protein
MVYEKSIDTTAGKITQLVCDCEEFKNNSAATCKHIRDYQIKHNAYDVPYSMVPIVAPKITIRETFISPARRYFPMIDKESRFYKNCKRQRKAEAKICQDCPFRKGIEEQE